MQSDLQAPVLAQNLPPRPLSLREESIRPPSEGEDVGSELSRTRIFTDPTRAPRQRSADDILQIYLRDIARFPKKDREEDALLTKTVREGILKIRRELLSLPHFIDYTRDRLLAKAKGGEAEKYQRFFNAQPSIHAPSFQRAWPDPAKLAAFFERCENVGEAIVRFGDEQRLNAITSGDYLRGAAMLQHDLSMFRDLLTTLFGNRIHTNIDVRSKTLGVLRGLCATSGIRDEAIAEAFNIPRKDWSRCPFDDIRTFMEVMQNWELEHRVSVDKFLERGEAIAKVEAEIKGAKLELYHAKLRHVPALISGTKVRWWALNREVRVDFLDLIQEGNLGLLEAIDRFEPERGIQFMTYASTTVWRYVRDYLRVHASVVRPPRLEIQIAKDVDKELDDITLRHGAGLSPASLLAVRRLLSRGDGRDGRYEIKLCRSDTDLETPEWLSEDESKTGPITNLPSTADTVLEAIQSERREFILRMIRFFPARDRQIVTMYYGLNGEDMRTLKQIGEELGITESRVWQIMNTNLIPQLKKLLKIYESDSE